MISTIRAFIDGVRYMAEVDFATAPRVKRRCRIKFWAPVDTGLPELGIEKLFTSEGRSWQSLLSGVLLITAGLAADAYLVIDSFTVLRVIGALLGLAVTAWVGLRLLGGTSVIHKALAAGKEAEAPVSRMDLDRLQQAVATHGFNSILPSSVLTHLDAARFAMTLRRELASRERAKLEQIRGLW